MVLCTKHLVCALLLQAQTESTLCVLLPAVGESNCNITAGGTSMEVIRQQVCSSHFRP